MQDFQMLGVAWNSTRVMQEYLKNDSTYWSVNDTYSSSTENQFEYYAECNGTAFNVIETSISQSYYLFIDNVYPSFNSSLENLSFWTLQMNWSINTTERYPRTLTVNHTCTQMANYSNSSLSTNFRYSDTFNTTNCSLGQINTTIRLCDNASNCVNKTYTWYNMGRLTINASSFLDTPITDFGILKDGTPTGNTTTGTYHLNNLSAGDYNISIDPTLYQTDSYNQTINTTLHTLWFKYLYGKQSINITYYDFATNTIMNGTNVTIQVIGTTSFTNRTDTGQAYFDLLIPDSYTLLYDATGYQQGKYILHLDYGSVTHLNLYMQNSSNSNLVLITVEDRFGTSLQDVEIAVQRWHNNSWVTDQIVATDFKGQTEAYYILSTTFYNHVLKYDGNIYFGEINNDETKKIIYAEDVANGIKFNIDISESDQLAEYQNLYGVTGNLSFTNNTNTTGYFRFFWTDDGNEERTGCVTIYKGGDMTYLNSTCTTTATGTIILNINHTTKGQSVYVAKATIDGYAYDEYIVMFGVNPDSIDWGITGYIVGFLFVLFAFFMFLSNPAIGIMVGTIVFVVLGAMGLYFKDMEYGLYLVMLIIAYLIASMKSESGVNA